MDLTIRGGMGGKETIVRLLEIDPQAKAIVASGYTTDPIIDAYQQYGFCGRLVKPYQAAKLDHVLRQVLLDAAA